MSDSEIKDRLEEIDARIMELRGELAGLEAEEAELARELSRRELEGKEKKAGLIP